MRERTYLFLVVILAAAVFAGLAGYLRAAQARAIADATAAAAEPDSPKVPPRPIAEVARLVRSLKLVTVEVLTGVESSSANQSWRGDVKARVAAPVRLLYGCDLSGVGGAGEDGSVGLRANLLTQGLTLRVPRPTRLAAEIDGAHQTHDVELGWARFRDLSGEYQLGLARTALYEQARALTLTPSQREQVEQTTREQLVALVRAFAGTDLTVEVEFFDPESRDGVAGADERGSGAGGGR